MTEKSGEGVGKIFAPIIKPVKMAVGWGIELGKKKGISYTKEYGPWLTRRKRLEEERIKSGAKGNKGI